MKRAVLRRWDAGQVGPLRAVRSFRECGAGPAGRGRQRCPQDPPGRRSLRGGVPGAGGRAGPGMRSSPCAQLRGSAADPRGRKLCLGCHAGLLGSQILFCYGKTISSPVLTKIYTYIFLEKGLDGGDSPNTQILRRTIFDD